MTPLATEMTVPVFLLTFHGAEENGVISTHSDILCLNPGPACREWIQQTLLFQDFRCLQDQEGFPPPYTCTRLSRGFFCSRLSVETPEAIRVEEVSLSSLNQCCRLGIENQCLTGMHSLSVQMQ